jgi:hypothetical protein
MSPTSLADVVGELVKRYFRAEDRARVIASLRRAGVPVPAGRSASPGRRMPPPPPRIAKAVRKAIGGRSCSGRAHDDPPTALGTVASCMLPVCYPYVAGLSILGP